MPFFILLLLVALGAVFFAYRAWTRRQHRAALIDTGLTDREWDIVMRHAPLVTRMPAELRPALAGKISLFLGQVEFIGYDGLEVTDEIAFSVAAQACLLVVNTDHWYDNLTTVLIYPGAFKSLQKDHDGYIVSEEVVVRSGESWSRGPVILSWRDSQQGAMNTEDGHNVVLHEFAHQLDDLSGHTDGAPLMAEGQSLQDWSRVVLGAFERHVENVQRGKPTVLDAYGATNHQEFFAVAVETFFEKSQQLRAEEPEVYAQLARLLNLDPVSWDQATAKA